jgi:hypothetical protein
MFIQKDLINLRGSVRGLKQYNTIQKVISCFLITLLALSNTPKIFLHDLIADHKDVSYSGKITQGQSVTKEGIYCHFDHFVAESPFVQTINSSECLVLFSYSPLKEDYKSNFYTTHFTHSTLRGPPSKA